MSDKEMSSMIDKLFAHEKAAQTMSGSIEQEFVFWTPESATTFTLSYWVEGVTTTFPMLFKGAVQQLVETMRSHKDSEKSSAEQVKAMVESELLRVFTEVKNFQVSTVEHPLPEVRLDEYGIVPEEINEDGGDVDEVRLMVTVRGEDAIEAAKHLQKQLSGEWGQGCLGVESKVVVSVLNYSNAKARKKNLQ